MTLEDRTYEVTGIDATATDNTTVHTQSIPAGEMWAVERVYVISSGVTGGGANNQAGVYLGLVHDNASPQQTYFASGNDLLIDPSSSSTDNRLFFRTFSPPLYVTDKESLIIKVQNDNSNSVSAGTYTVVVVARRVI